MRDTVFANCESDFVVAAIKKKKRLDGRLFDELRNIELHFGSDYGCAYVTLGETKVLAQVSCELSEPRNARKNEGNLFVNVEINDMVCGVFETGHQGHLGIHTNRLIEKCIKDSRCVDLEALCIISEEQAWEIRVDVSVLNYDGNLFTCCSLAALAALAHFKTPHVTIENSEVRIESIREHEPEPLSLHHYPILVAFAIFGEGDDILLDPTELEEKVCESELIIGMNSFRELCGMHFSGRTTGNRSLIVKAAQQASLVAVNLVKLLKSTLEKDNEERKKNRGKTEGLVSAIHLDRILSASQDRNSLRVTMREIEETARSLFVGQQPTVTGMESDNEQDQRFQGKESENEEMEVAYSRDKRLGTLLPPMEKIPYGAKWIPSGNKNAWTLPNATLSDDGSGASDDDDVDYVKTITDEDRIVDRIELNDSGEEQETVMLGAKEAEYSGNPDELMANRNHALVAPPSESGDCVTDEVCLVRSGKMAFDSSSYSLTSPSYSSGSSLHSTSSSSGSYVVRKPNYNPPSWDWSQPSTSCGPVPSSDKVRKKLPHPVYSPSSPSSDSSTSHDMGHSSSLPLTRQQRANNTRNSSRHTSTSIRNRTSRSNLKSSRLTRQNIRHKMASKNKQHNKVERTQLLPCGLVANKPKSKCLPYSNTVDYCKSRLPSFTLDGMSSAQYDNQGLASHSGLSPTYSSSSPSKPPPSTGLGSADDTHIPDSPVYIPSSPSVTESPSSPVYISPKCSPAPTGRRLSFSPSPRSKLHQTQSDSNTKYDVSPLYSGSQSKQTPPSSPKLFQSPVYSPSSPSPSHSPTSCPHSSPKYSPASQKRLSFSPKSPPKPNMLYTTSPNQVIPSPTYSPSSPSKQTPSCHESTTSKVLHSPLYYSPSSPSLPCSPRSPKISFSPKKSVFFSPISKPCQPSLSSTVPSPSFSPSSPSKAPLSPAYSPSSPSYIPSHSMSSPSKAPPSPDFTPSSPSKPPASPSVSPSFLSSPSTTSNSSPHQPRDSLNHEIMTYLERKSQSPQLPGSSSTADSSSLYSPISSQSPVYSSDSSSKRNKMLKKRVKLQRSSPTSPGSVVSELMEIGVSRPSESKKLKLFSPSNSPTLPCSSRPHQSGTGSPQFSMPSPKYSPSSKMISSEISEAVVPPYSPSSPSHPPPSPSINLSSPPSSVGSDRFSLSKVKNGCSPEISSIPHRPLSYGSPHYSLDSLSSYSSSSFSSGLPSPSSGSPRYSPSLSESEARPNHQLTPSPLLSPSVMFMSPRVSSSSSSPARETPLKPSHSEVDNLPQDITLPTASLSMFSPSVSPQLPNFSPSSPSHQPPSPAYSPSSPSYSSGSCSPPESTSSGHLGNTFTSSPGSPSSHSSTSTEPPTVILKVFIPKPT